MARHLLTVEDAIEIRGRGLLLAPDFDLADPSPVEVRIEVRRPDGSSEELRGRLTIPCVIGAKIDRPPRFALELAVPRTRVPVGSEIWVIDD